MYEYRAICDRVVDGDTADFTVDLGFGIKKKDRFRFAGINTPELRGEEREAGLKAAEYVSERILGKSVIIRTNKDSQGKYGRYIATILYGDGLTDLNQELVRVGMAKVASY